MTYYDLEFLEGFFLPERADPNEKGKTISLVKQLDDSITWMTFIAHGEKDAAQKAIIQKEVTAATWERDRLIKELTKAITV